jgi:hypothetical protein
MGARIDPYGPGTALRMVGCPRGNMTVTFGGI